MKKILSTLVLAAFAATSFAQVTVVKPAPTPASAASAPKKAEKKEVKRAAPKEEAKK